MFRESKNVSLSADGASGVLFLGNTFRNGVNVHLKLGGHTADSDAASTAWLYVRFATDETDEALASPTDFDIMIRAGGSGFSPAYLEVAKGRITYHLEAPDITDSFVLVASELSVDPRELPESHLPALGIGGRESCMV